MRVRPGIRSLRFPEVYPSVRNALAASSKGTFRLIHFSVQDDHIHLMVEASEKRSLSLGLRGLAIRVARSVNRSLGRSGPIWGDRYHARALASPREVRHGLVYVLMNFRKHMRRAPAAVDPCSSGGWFDGFRDHVPVAGRDPPPVQAPRTWLATHGWRRHGLISVRERPLKAA